MLDKKFSLALKKAKITEKLSMKAHTLENIGSISQSSHKTCCDQDTPIRETECQVSVFNFRIQTDFVSIVLDLQDNKLRLLIEILHRTRMANEFSRKNSIKRYRILKSGRIKCRSIANFQVSKNLLVVGVLQTKTRKTKEIQILNFSVNLEKETSLVENHFYIYILKEMKIKNFYLHQLICLLESKANTIERELR